MSAVTAVMRERADATFDALMIAHGALETERTQANADRWLTALADYVEAMTVLRGEELDRRAPRLAVEW